MPFSGAAGNQLSVPGKTPSPFGQPQLKACGTHQHRAASTPEVQTPHLGGAQEGAEVREVLSLWFKDLGRILPMKLECWEKIAVVLGGTHH